MHISFFSRIGQVLGLNMDPSYDLIAFLRSGDVLCRLVCALYPKVKCQLLDKGSSYAIHKIVFFLELCKSLKIKRSLLFTIADLLVWPENDLMKKCSLSVLRTILALEKHARRSGWSGPSLGIKKNFMLNGESLVPADTSSPMPAMIGLPQQQQQRLTPPTTPPAYQQQQKPIAQPSPLQNVQTQQSLTINTQLHHQQQDKNRKSSFPQVQHQPQSQVHQQVPNQAQNQVQNQIHSVPNQQQWQSHYIPNQNQLPQNVFSQPVRPNPSQSIPNQSQSIPNQLQERKNSLPENRTSLQGLEPKNSGTPPIQPIVDRKNSGTPQPLSERKNSGTPPIPLMSERKNSLTNMANVTTTSQDHSERKNSLTAMEKRRNGSLPSPSDGSPIFVAPPPPSIPPAQDKVEEIPDSRNSMYSVFGYYADSNRTSVISNGPGLYPIAKTVIPSQSPTPPIHQSPTLKPSILDSRPAQSSPMRHEATQELLKKDELIKQLEQRSHSIDQLVSDQDTHIQNLSHLVDFLNALIKKRQRRSKRLSLKDSNETEMQRYKVDVEIEELNALSGVLKGIIQVYTDFHEKLKSCLEETRESDSDYALIGDHVLEFVDNMQKPFSMFAIIGIQSKSMLEIVDKGETERSEFINRVMQPFIGQSQPSGSVKQDWVWAMTRTVAYLNALPKALSELSKLVEDGQDSDDKKIKLAGLKLDCFVKAVLETLHIQSKDL